MPAQPEYRYDFFISFADGDRDWVEGYLLPALGLPKERVITGQSTSRSESFQPGATVVNEFERAVTSSRFTVLVLSRAYLSDRWSVFGEQLASYSSVAEQRDRMIPLLRERDARLPLHIEFRVSLDCTEQGNWETEISRLRQLLAQAEPQPERIPCPYLGMIPFQEKDARFFYGREAEIKQMLLYFRHQRLLFVIGPSGCGKSSLVFAGLLPQLQRSAYFDEGFWLVKQMRPGPHPMQELCRVMGGDPNSESIAKLLGASPPAQRLLLAVDQFEELFSQTERSEQSGFITALKGLGAVEHCVLLITMRADFYPELMNSDMWGEVSSHRIEIAPLRDDALRQAIEKPARDVGVYLERGLADRLVSDAAEEPGALPLLQETMRLLWAEMARRFLPLGGYKRLGVGTRNGLAVAIANKADATLNDLPSTEQKAIARRIFLRLVQFGEGRPDTRRQQPVSSLGSERDDPQMFAQTLRHLEDNRLVTVTADEGGQEKKVDLAHEALITGWPQLQEWVEERRGAELTRRRLEDKAEEWIRLERKGGLLDSVEIKEAKRWLQSPDAADLGGQSVALRDLLKASRDAIEKQKQQEEEGRQRELEQARDRAEEQQRFAEEQRRFVLELSRSLEKERQSSYFANVALAERFWISNQSDRADDTLSLCHESLREWEWHYLRHLCYSELLRIAVDCPISALSLSFDGKTVAAGLADGRLLLLDCFSGALLNNFPGSAASILGVSFSPNGSALAVASGGALLTSAEGQLSVLDLPTGRSTVLLHSEFGVASVCFSPHGRYLAAADGSQICVFDVNNLSLIQQFAHPRCHGVAFHPAGERLAAVARSPNFVDDGTLGLVKIWDIRTAVEAALFSGRQLKNICFTPDGSTLVAASETYLVGFDSVNGASKFSIRAHSDGITAVAVSDDGRCIASGGEEGIVKLWEVTELDAPPISYLGHTALVSALTFSSDCERVVSTSADRTVRVWDATTEQRSITYTFGLDANEILSPTGVGSFSNFLAVATALSPDGTQYASVSDTSGSGATSSCR